MIIKKSNLVLWIENLANEQRAPFHYIVTILSYAYETSAFSLFSGLFYYF